MMSNIMYYSRPLIAFQTLLEELYELVDRTDSVHYKSVYQALQAVSKDRGGRPSLQAPERIRGEVHSA
jgi:hypothetical protein